MSIIAELGRKAMGVYGLGRKALDGIVSLGHKAGQIANSPFVRGAYNFLPMEIKAPVSAVYEAGKGVVKGAEALQQKLNAGEQVARRMAPARSIELKRQSVVNVPRPMEQGAGLRIPDRLMMEPKTNPMMKF